MNIFKIQMYLSGKKKSIKSVFLQQNFNLILKGLGNICIFSLKDRHVFNRNLCHILSVTCAANAAEVYQIEGFAYGLIPA